MTEKSSKTRQGRANRQQIEAFVSHLEQHPYMATGKFTGMNANENMQEKWEQLSEYLNSLATDGKKKDVRSWKTTWRDYKSKVSEKVQKLRQARSRTGNNPISIILNELEKRILGIIGHDYVQGLTNVPDSFPEENYNAVEELALGNTDVLNNPPVPVVIEELNDIHNTEICTEDERLTSVNNEMVLDNEDFANEPAAMENIIESAVLQNIRVNE